MARSGKAARRSRLGFVTGVWLFGQALAMASPVMLCTVEMVASTPETVKCEHHGMIPDACPMHRPPVAPIRGSSKVWAQCSGCDISLLALVTGVVAPLVPPVGVHVEPVAQPLSGSQPQPIDRAGHPESPPPRA